MFRIIASGAINGVVLGVLVGTVAGSAIVSHAHDTVTAAPTYHQAPAPSPAAGHLCWSGKAPKSMEGRIPGGVVLSRHEGSPKVYLHTPAAVGAALDHVFEGAHEGMTVWAFCR